MGNSLKAAGHFQQKRRERGQKKNKKTTLILCSIREYSVGPKKKKKNLGNIGTDNNIT